MTPGFRHAGLAVRRGRGEHRDRAGRLVALSAGGDAVCRAYVRNLRLDIPGSRSFLDQYIDVP